jgi:hypothetical protein
MNKQTVFGEIRGIPGDVQQTRIIPFAVSSYKRDRHGTVLNQDNWQLDSYKRNPVVGFQHHLGSGSLFSEPNPDYIIGKSVNIYFEGSGRDKKLVADCQFEPPAINPLAEKVFQKCLFGSLRSASVGFIPQGQGHYGEGSEGRGAEEETYYFEGQELLEWSIVSIPSNTDAVKKSMAEAPAGVQNYAFNSLNQFSPGMLKELNQEEILILLDAQNYMELRKYNNPLQVITLMREMRSRQNQLMTERPGVYYFDVSGKFRKIADQHSP